MIQSVNDGCCISESWHGLYRRDCFLGRRRSTSFAVRLKPFMPKSSKSTSFQIHDRTVETIIWEVKLYEKITKNFIIASCIEFVAFVVGLQFW